MVKYFPCYYGFTLYERLGYLHNLQTVLNQKAFQAELS